MQSAVTPGREAAAQFFQIQLDVGQFLLAQNAFEDIETQPRIGLHDIGMKIAIVIEPDWASVTERERPLLSFEHIGFHGFSIVAVMGGAGLDRTSEIKFCHCFLSHLIGLRQ